MGYDNDTDPLTDAPEDRFEEVMGRFLGDTDGMTAEQVDYRRQLVDDIRLSRRTWAAAKDATGQDDRERRRTATGKDVLDALDAQPGKPFGDILGRPHFRDFSSDMPGGQRSTSNRLHDIANAWRYRICYVRQFAKPDRLAADDAAHLMTYVLYTDQEEWCMEVERG